MAKRKNNPEVFGRRARSVFFLALGLLLLAAVPEAPALDRPRLVMLGDSLTAGCDWGSHLPGAEVVNLGVAGDTTGLILARLGQVADQQPDLVFLQAGINDFGRHPRLEAILERHREIRRRLRAELPGARLVVVSLLPVSGRRFPGWNPAIREFNQRLRAEAVEEGLTFIDLFPPLADGHGELRRDFTYDGLHLTARAYEVWLERVRSYVDFTVDGGERTSVPAAETRS